MNDSVKSRKAEWLVTLPSLAWLLLFFAVPALIVLAFTFHGHTANGGVGEWSLSTWRELVDPDYPTIVWKTIRISCGPVLTGKSKEMQQASFDWIKSRLDEWGMPTED